MLGNEDLTVSSATGKKAGLALAVLDQQPFGSLLLDKNQRICFWSEWLSQWAGIDPKQAEGRMLDSLVPALFHTDFLAAMNAALLDQRKTEWSQQLDPERLDSVESIFTCSRREMPLHSVLFLPMSVPEHGDCCLVLISESPFDPIVLKERSNGAGVRGGDGSGKLPVYLESDESAVLSIDREGFLQSVNPVAEKLFGYSCSQLAGKPVRVILPEFDDALLTDISGLVEQEGKKNTSCWRGLPLMGKP